MVTLIIYKTNTKCDKLKFKTIEELADFIREYILEWSKEENRTLLKLQYDIIIGGIDY